MKKTLSAILLLMAGVMMADTTGIRYSKTIDVQSSKAPNVELFRANDATLRLTFQDNGSAVNLSNTTVSVAWFQSAQATNVITATVTLVNDGTNGIVDATFDSADLNYTPASYMYSASVLDSGGSILTWNQGTFKIKPSPITTSTGTNSFGQILNWATFTQYINTASSGPYRGGTNVVLSANSDGSVDINSTQVDVSGIISTQSTHTTQIANLTTTQSLHRTYINTVSNDLDTLEGSFATASNLLDNTVSTQTLHRSYINTISNDLDTLESSYAVSSNLLDNVVTTQATHTSQISSLLSTQTLHRSYINTVSNDLDTLESAYAVSSNLLDNVVSTQALQQATLSTNVAKLDTANTFHQEQTVSEDSLTPWEGVSVQNSNSGNGAYAGVKVASDQANGGVRAFSSAYANASLRQRVMLMNDDTDAGNASGAGIYTVNGDIVMMPNGVISWMMDTAGEVNGYANTWSNFVIGGDVVIANGDTSGDWTGTLDSEEASDFHDAGQLTNQYRTLTWTVQDPTNSITWPLFHPADGDGDWTIAEVSCWVNGGDVTGLCHWVVGDVPLTTGGTSVETGVLLNSTRTVDSSLSGFTTISNDQAIAIYFTALSEFDATNVVNATVRLTK